MQVRLCAHYQTVTIIASLPPNQGSLSLHKEAKMIQSFLPFAASLFPFPFNVIIIHLANSSPSFFLPVYLIRPLLSNRFISFNPAKRSCAVAETYPWPERPCIASVNPACSKFQPPHVQLQHAFIHQVEINLATLASSTNSNSQRLSYSRWPDLHRAQA